MKVSSHVHIFHLDCEHYSTLVHSTCTKQRAFLSKASNSIKCMLLYQFHIDWLLANKPILIKVQEKNVNFYLNFFFWLNVQPDFNTLIDYPS